MASALGPDCVRNYVYRSLGSRDGHAFPERVARDWKWFIAGATFLLGAQRDNVGDRVNRHSFRSVNARVSGSNVDRKRLLHFGSFSVEARISNG